MIKDYNLKNKIPHIVSVLTLVIVASLLIYRSLFGFDWSEETYYSSLLYSNLMSGDVFQNMQFLSFWPIIIKPFVEMYNIIVGSGDGIILYLRILYIIFTLSLAFYLYKTSVKVVTPWIALTISLILLIFVPVEVASFSYNSIVILMTIFSILLINNGITGNNVSYFHILLSGFSFGIAMVSYPTIAIAILILPIHILIKSFHLNRLDQKWNFVLVWFLGLFIVPALIFTHLFVNYSWLEITESFNRVLTNTFNHNNGLTLGNVFYKYFEPIRAIFSFELIGILVLTLLAFINSLFKKERLNFNSSLNNHERLTYIGTIILLVLFVILEFLMFTTILTQNNIAYIFIPLTIGMPILFFMTNRFSSKYTILYLMGIILSIAMYLTTNDFNSYFIGLLLSTMAVILYIGEYLMKEDFDFKYKVPIYGIIFYFAFSVLFSLTYSRINTVYRDEPISQLTTRIEVGPGKGLYTTKESASKYKEIYKAIKKYVPEEGTVFFTKDLPFGYICTNAKPSLPQLSNLEINSNYLNDYFTTTYYLLPDCVFQVAEGYGYLKKDGTYSNDNNPADGIFGKLLIGPNYETIKLDCATIYLKIK